MEEEHYSYEEKIKGIAGLEKDYKVKQGIKNQIRDWLLPKFKRKEKLKSGILRSGELCTPGGICATTGAQLSKRTVGGKKAFHVLPKDYLRSSDFEVIGRIGTDKKTPKLLKAFLTVPKYTVKGLAAGIVGTTAYGIAKGVQALSKKPKSITKKAVLSLIYENSLKDELVKISKGM